MSTIATATYKLVWVGSGDVILLGETAVFNELEHTIVGGIQPQDDDDTGTVKLSTQNRTQDKRPSWIGAKWEKVNDK